MKPSIQKPSACTRRQFLATGTGALAFSLINAGAANHAGAENAADLPDINPGFVAPQYYDEKEQAALLDVLESGSPFRYYGPKNPVKVKTFEENFADFMGVPYALAVTSGTAALDCAVTGLGIGPGDEVIVPAYTWWSDYTCVVHAGALPVFAEIDRTLCLDPTDFARKITPRTKAVIAVHLLGGPCDLDPILETAKARGIAVLEDAAQCAGGSYHGKRLGSIGNVGIFSFQLHKMISSGEGGAVITNDPLVYERACRFHDMGMMRDVFKDRLGEVRAADFAGENFRMSEFTGGVLWAQLPKLNRMIQDMRRHAEAVREGIRAIPGIQLRHRPDPQGDNGYAVYLEMKNQEARDTCIRELRKRKIPASTLTGSVLLPIEESVINKRTRHPQWPSFLTGTGKAIEYGPHNCPQTLEIFDRFVQIRIGPKYTDEINRRIVAAVHQVYPMVS